MEDRIPHAWIGYEVWVETMRAATCEGWSTTLMDVTSEGISVSYSYYDEEGPREDISFIPWTNLHRLLKTQLR